MNKKLESLDFKKLGKILSDYSNKKVKIKEIKEVASGYHSVGYEITTDDKSFFIKKAKSYDLGLEFPERRLNAYIVSDGMYNRVNSKPKSVGVLVKNKTDYSMLPKVFEDTDIFHIQEFEKEGYNMWESLENRKDKKKIDNLDKTEIQSLVKTLCKIHKIKPKIKEKEKLSARYNDSIRNILTNPELTIMLMHDFPKDHPILPIDKQKDLIGYMYEIIHEWKDRYDRISALHGDCWGANLYINKKDRVWPFDFSRIPWGDPGYDVGWWFSQYMWLYHETKNNYFKDLGNYFLETYKKISKDNEILEASVLVTGLMGIIWTTPRFYPNLDIEVGKRYINNVFEILIKRKIIWKD